MSQYRYVNNEKQRRVDGMEKVTGKAVYAGDVRMLGMLHAKGVYAQYPHAKILRIDKTGALAIPGVVDVITAADLPGKKTFGEVVDDQYPLAYDKTRMYGDVVAVVAAETLEIAEEAAKHVKVEYEVLPPLFSPREAMESDVCVTDRFPNNVYCCLLYTSNPIRWGRSQRRWKPIGMPQKMAFTLYLPAAPAG